MLKVRLISAAPILTLLFLSLVTHFYLFGYPNEAVFDEVYFTSHVSHYLTHNYYFDLHPPLGKLLYTGLAFMLGIEPLPEELTIGASLPGLPWILLRLLPLLMGVFLPLIIYKFSRLLSLSKITAFAAGLFVIFENSLLVQSRFTLMDIPLLFFGFLGLMLYILALQKGSRWLKIAGVASITCAISIKWTGGSFMLLAIVAELYNFFKNNGLAIKYFFVKKLPRLFALFIVIPFALYISVFAVHLGILTKSGPGDAFMSQIFQKTLEGSEYEHREDIRPTPFIEKFAELNLVMLHNNLTLEATHDYGSVWYTWPFMKRTIFYWEETTEDTQAFIYLIGNPFLYYLAVIAVAVLFCLLMVHFFTKKQLFRDTAPAWFLLIGYALNMLPFMSIHRVMFLYHYMAALLFGLITIAFLIDQLPENIKKKVAYTTVAVSVIFFLYFSPLTYGIPLPKSSEPWLFWMSSWR